MQDAPVSSVAAANLLDKKQRQRLKAEGIELFNQKPKKGIALLQSHGLVSHDPVEVAHFLKQTAGLDYAMMGDFLSDPSESSKLVCHTPAS
jgi:Sec7-like guanine-nucleotide exchange factor